MDTAVDDGLIKRSDERQQAIAAALTRKATAELKGHAANHRARIGHGTPTKPCDDRHRPSEHRP
jgi:hypothetical protein